MYNTVQFYRKTNKFYTQLTVAAVHNQIQTSTKTQVFVQTIYFTRYVYNITSNITVHSYLL